MRSIYSFDHTSLVDDSRHPDDDHDIVIHDLADFDRLYGSAGDGGSPDEPPDEPALAV